MQINAITGQNFKGDYSDFIDRQLENIKGVENEIDKVRIIENDIKDAALKFNKEIPTDEFSPNCIEDIDTTDNDKDIDEEYDNQYDTEDKEALKQNGNSTEKSSIKSIPSIIASIGGVFLVSYLAINKAHKCIGESAKAFLTDNEKIIKNVQNSIDGIKADLSKSETIKNITKNNNFKKIANVANALKNDTVNIIKDRKFVSGVGALTATTYISSTDGNKDGVADIAQRGVNSIESTLKACKPIANAVDLLT